MLKAMGDLFHCLC